MAHRGLPDPWSRPGGLRARSSCWRCDIPEQSSPSPGTRAAEGVRGRHPSGAWAVEMRHVGAPRDRRRGCTEGRTGAGPQDVLRALGSEGMALRAARAGEHRAAGTPAAIPLPRLRRCGRDGAGGADPNRSGHRYKPSALRTIEEDLRLYLVPNFGGKLMVGVARGDLQRLVSGWLAEGMESEQDPDRQRRTGAVARLRSHQGTRTHAHRPDTWAVTPRQHRATKTDRHS